MGYKKVCFNCRKSFSQGTDINEMREMKCPDCGTLMNDVSHRFRSPKKGEIKKWSAAKFLFDNGFNYHHVYDKIYTVRGMTVLQGYVKYPENMREAKEFVEKYKDQLDNL